MTEQTFRDSRLARSVRRLLAGRPFRWATAMIVAAALISGLWILGERARDFLYASAYFEIQSIEIQGVSPEVEERLRERLAKETRGLNLLAVSATELASCLEEIPEVREASVRRRFPSLLLVVARERFPSVVLVADRAYSLDSQRVAVEELDSREFLDSSLPLITAQPAPAVKLGQPVNDVRLIRMMALLELLRRQSPELELLVAEYHLGDRGDITLIFEGGTEVRLGQAQPAQILPVLEAFWTQTQGLQGIEYAELRYRNQVAFRRSNPPAAAFPPKAKSSTATTDH